MKILSISFVILFLELVFIRLINTEVRIFAYLQNFILIVCFLSLGCGCIFSARRKFLPEDVFIPFSFLVICLKVPTLVQLFASISIYLSDASGYQIWYQNPSIISFFDQIYSLLVGVCLTLILLRLLWLLFFPLGVLLGQEFQKFDKRLRAYSYDIAGSLCGVLFFTLLSIAELDPVYWIATATILLILLFLRQIISLKVLFPLTATILVTIYGIVRQGHSGVTWWSPYQKLAILEDSDGGYPVINVNNVGYQKIFDVSGRISSHYDIPYLANPEAKSVLIVGAGSGNDVAAAVKHGIKRIVAVEIDSSIVRVGRKFHPNRPYDFSQVEVEIDDARSYFERSQEKFDLIIFGLLDSHTLAGMTNVRLDHFVYTLESLTSASRLLNPSGLLTLSFAVTNDFQKDRLFALLKGIFNDKVRAFRYDNFNQGWGGGQMFFAGNLKLLDKDLLNSLIGTNLSEITENSNNKSIVTTDDWPYFYLESKGIPVIYYYILIPVLLLVGVSLSMGSTDIIRVRWGKEEWFFFVLGAAFMTYETLIVTKASLILGITWVVNAGVISAILFLIFLANLTTPYLKKWAFLVGIIGVLFSILIILYFPIIKFLPNDILYRFILGSLFFTLPMFFSGLLFASVFQSVKNPHTALGSNLIGSFFGACLQLLSMQFGFSCLFLAVGALYFLSCWLKPEFGRTYS